jgi:ATP/maltotriose-dependent transcriptional regulator MalT
MNKKIIITSILCTVIVILLISLIGYRIASTRSAEIAEADSLFMAGTKNLGSSTLVDASVNFTKASLIYERYDNQRGLLRTNLYMAFIYIELNHMDESYKILNNSKQLLSYEDDKFFIRFYYRCLASVQTLWKRDYYHAIENEKKVMDLWGKYRDNKCNIDAMADYSNMAEIYIYMGKNEKAKEIISEVEKHTSNIKKRNVIPETLLCRGMIFKNEGNVDSAYTVLSDAVDYSHGHKSDTSIELSALKMLIEIDSIRDDVHSLQKHQQKYDVLKNSLIGNMDMYVDIINSRSKLVKEQSQRIMAEAKHNITMFTLAFGICVLLAISIILLLLYRRTQIKKELAISEKERLAAQVERDILEKELMEMKISKKDEHINTVSKENMEMSIQLAAVTSNDKKATLKSFERSFREIDRDFIKTISEKYPAITHNELFLMSLIRYGLSSKEIINVMSITMNTLHTMRYRLKKKLDLIESNTDLDNFLKSL